jgi:signal transduction histidine kinase
VSTRVLIVEDDAVVLRLLKEFAAVRGHEVAGYASPLAAWDAFCANPFPIVLLDWMMEEMSGIEFVQRLRRRPRGSDTVVVMVTVKNREPDLLQALAAGVDDFLPKPVSREALNIRLHIAESRVKAIEERRRAEEALQREQRARQEAEETRRQALERTSRLASLGFLAAGMAHEINNPLQGILSHLRNMRRALPKDFAELESVDMVERGVNSIGTLVQKLLMLGSAPSDGESTASAREVINFVVQLLQHQLRASRIQTVCDVKEDMVIAISRPELTQVLLNLILNARDAMPNGGTLTLTAELDAVEATIAVQDTGSGIPQELADRVFSPFFTTKGSMGTGLGLPVAVSILAKHGGRLEYTHLASIGALFRVRLPLADPL